MKLLAVACIAMWLNIAAQAGHAQTVDRDFGPIVRSSPNTIVVNGGEGRHVLVPTRVCEWCKRGTRVVVTFQELGKANVAPDPEASLSSAVPVLVLRRGQAQR